MIHNIVVLGNKEYQAVRDLHPHNCTGCALVIFNCEGVECEWESREDSTEVIYKSHHKPTIAELTSYAAAIRFDAAGGV